MIGLDTSALIDLVNGEKSIISVLEKQPSVAINSLVVMEFSVGLQSSNILLEIISQFHEISFKSMDAVLANETFQKLKKKGQEISIIDCCIAQTYLNQGINTIVTKNVKHFSKIDKLNTISY